MCKFRWSNTYQYGVIANRIYSLDTHQNTKVPIRAPTLARYEKGVVVLLTRYALSELVAPHRLELWT